MQSVCEQHGFVKCIGLLPAVTCLAIIGSVVVASVGCKADDDRYTLQGSCGGSAIPEKGLEGTMLAIESRLKPLADDIGIEYVVEQHDGARRLEMVSDLQDFYVDIQVAELGPDGPVVASYQIVAAKPSINGHDARNAARRIVVGLCRAIE